MLGTALATIMGASQGRIDPAAWYAGGAPGVAYDFTDLSTMRQDIAGTVAVTAAGQSVGWARDLSRASGNHLVAATDARRTVVGTSANGLPCLSFDGDHRGYRTAATLDMTSVNRVTVVASVRATANADGVIAEFSEGWFVQAGTFIAYRGSDSIFGFASRGSSGIPISRSSVLPAPALAVLVGEGNIAAPSARITTNGVAASAGTGTQGTGNFGNWSLNVGCRSAFSSVVVRFSGDISRLAVIGGSVSAGVLSEMVAWARAGNNAY